MALNFEAVSLAKTSAPRKAKEIVFDDEFVKEYTEACEYILNGGHDALKVDHGTHEKREEWFAKAQAYGKTLNTPLAIRRIKGFDTMNKEHGVNVFTIETEADAEERKEAGRKAKERAEILKSYGHTLRPGRGGKTNEMIEAEERTLAKHYSKSETQQVLHLEGYRNKVAEMKTPAGVMVAE